MDKSRQQQLVRWLKQHRSAGARLIKLSVILGAISAGFIIAQAALIAEILQQLLMKKRPAQDCLWAFATLAGCFIARGGLLILRERVGFAAGAAIRQQVRQRIMQRLDEVGPVWVATKPIGSWTTLLHEQIENMQQYYARYLPQMMLAGLIPLLILLTLLPVNWAAATILLLTAPLIPLFMAMVGMGAADANRRNFQALARLGGDFLDRLRGLETLRLFDRQAAEQQAIAESSQQFRQRTMEVLRIAFLSSAVLEFFASVSIAIVAVYFAFSYLGLFHFGGYSTPVTLFAGFITLLLAPEFFQPLRDLGTFYHAKAQAIGAADQLEQFLTQTPDQEAAGASLQLADPQRLEIIADGLVALTPDGQAVAGPFNFTLKAGARVALVGPSGAGKSSLLNVLAGFMPYQGSLTINGQELKQLDKASWQALLGWVGQNPRLFASRLRDNIQGAQPLDEQQLAAVLKNSGVDQFLPRLANGLETEISDDATSLSVGQAQRIAVARALAKPCHLLLLDEPTASLDSYHERQVSAALTQASYQQTSLLVTHQLTDLNQWDQVWVIDQGVIIEQGRLDELLTRSGRLRQMWDHRQGTIDL